MANQRGSLPTPSRLMLNLGIVAGGVVGFILQALTASDNIQAFLITGVCAMLGAFIFSYIDVTRQQRS